MQVRPANVAFTPGANWRYNYNPLVGLTMSRLVSMLNMAERGYYADISWLFHYIEKRDATLLAVKRRRFAAIKTLDWSIKVKEKFAKKTKGGDSKPTDAAKKQQEFLHECYDGVDNLKASIEFLAGADFRGFAHIEKHYRNQRPDEGVFHFEPVPQWYWARRMPDPKWYYNPRAISTNRGQEINPINFVIREVESPIDEIASICFLRKNMSQKDWDGFVETFGIPPLFIEMPMGVGTGGAEYQTIIEQVIGDSRGVLPNGAKVASVPDGSRGGRPFMEHIDYQDKQIVLAATGGLLTALSQATGMNEGQSKNHQDAFTDIAAGEAVLISEAFQRQYDEIELAREFPDADAMVYFALNHQDIGEGDKTIKDAQELNAAGYEMDVGQLIEKTGYRIKLKREIEVELQEKAAAAEQAKQEAAAKAEQEAAAQQQEEDPYAGFNFDEATQNSIRSVATEIEKATKASDAMLNRELENISEVAGRFIADAGVDNKKAIRYGDHTASRVRAIIGSVSK